MAFPVLFNKDNRLFFLILSGILTFLSSPLALLSFSLGTEDLYRAQVLILSYCLTHRQPSHIGLSSASSSVIDYLRRDSASARQTSSVLQ